MPGCTSRRAKIQALLLSESWYQANPCIPKTAPPAPAARPPLTWMLFSAATPMCRKTPYSTGIGMCCKTAGRGVSRARFPEGAALTGHPLLYKSLHTWPQHLLPQFPTAQFNFMAFCLSYGFEGFKARMCCWLRCLWGDITVFTEGKHAPSSLPCFPAYGGSNPGWRWRTQRQATWRYGLWLRIYKCRGGPASPAYWFPFYLLLCNRKLAPALCVAQCGLVFSQARAGKEGDGVTCCSPWIPPGTRGLPRAGSTSPASHKGCLRGSIDPHARGRR